VNIEEVIVKVKASGHNAKAVADVIRRPENPRSVRQRRSSQETL
jgi:hypothetical protein